MTCTSMTESVLMNVCIDVSASHDLETTAVLCILFFFHFSILLFLFGYRPLHAIMVNKGKEVSSL